MSAMSPDQLQRFRDLTAKGSMAGVSAHRFRCKCCGLNKSITGRKLVTPGHSRDGYKCADCQVQK